MIIHKEPLRHFILWMQQKKYFSLAGYSDAEWYCLLGLKEGDKTALGQVLSAKHGNRLLEILRRRHNDPRFLYAVPSCLWQTRDSNGLPGFAEGQIDWFLGWHRLHMEAFERDMILDDAARKARLFPLIRQLREMNSVIIGPKELRGLKQWVVAYRHFVEISTPNLHQEENGIERAVEEAKAYGQPGIYLVSAGVSAAVIIDLLHDAIPDSWFIDCGSIWDAFVGIGGQRQWRAELYADPAALEKWKEKNIYGNN